MDEKGYFGTRGGRPDRPPHIPDPQNIYGRNEIWGRRKAPVHVNMRVPMSWHHVVPLSMLKTAWDELIRRARTDNTTPSSKAQAADAVKKWLESTEATFYAELARKLLLEDKDFSTDMRLNLPDAICWPKWDLIEGPERAKIGIGCGDDPGNGLDDFSYHEYYSARCKNLLDLHQAIASPATISPIRVSSIFSRLRPFNSLQSATFDPTAWKMVLPRKNVKSWADAMDKGVTCTEQGVWSKTGLCDDQGGWLQGTISPWVKRNTTVVSGYVECWPSLWNPGIERVF